jgi:5-methylcytosine-specific restriction endonuclease McrA
VVQAKRCAHCGMEFVDRRLFCSHACMKAAELARMRQAYEPRPKLAKVCAECGQSFMGRGAQTCCSYPCRHRLEKRHRRHRLRANGRSERFSLREIAERDAWLCHICGQLVASSEASMDHLVPVVAGGMHLRSNVRLAHRSCNSHRGVSG